MKSDSELLSALSKSGKMNDVIEQAISEISGPDFIKAFYRKNKPGLKNPTIRRQVLIILGRTER